MRKKIIISENQLFLIKEDYDNNWRKQFNSWKRKNVVYRGYGDIYKLENGGMGKYGSGLYTTPSKKFAKQYGTVRMLVNAKPLNPKVIRSTNEAEIFIYEKIYSKCIVNGKPSSKEFYENGNTIASEMIAMGFDGLEIKGREMVNYSPNEANIFYADHNSQLIWYWETYHQNKD